MRVSLVLTGAASTATLTQPESSPNSAAQATNVAVPTPWAPVANLSVACTVWSGSMRTALGGVQEVTSPDLRQRNRTNSRVPPYLVTWKATVFTEVLGGLVTDAPSGSTWPPWA